MTKIKKEEELKLDDLEKVSGGSYSNNDRSLTSLVRDLNMHCPGCGRAITTKDVKSHDSFLNYVIFHCKNCRERYQCFYNDEDCSPTVRRYRKR